MAADVNEIISKEAIEGLKKANQYFIDLDGNIKRVIEESKAFNTSFRTLSSTQETIVSGQKKMQQQTEKMTQIQKDEAKALKATEAAAAALNKQRQAALSQLAKQEQKERELNATLKMEVKTLQDAQKQNSALTQARKHLDLTTKQGQATLKQYNASLNKNTEFIRANVDEAGKQRMEIGNYQKVWEGLGKYLGVIGGVFAGVWAAIKVGEAVIKTSQYATDEWKRTTEGLTNGWNEFMNSVANWDFTNLIDRINEAAKAGRDYADIVDLMEKRQAGLASQHKQENEEIAKLRLSYYEHNKTAAEKAAIMQKVIDLTQAQSQADAESAKQNYEGYLGTIIRAKGIDQRTLESYLLFKGTTEKKVQLIDDLKQAENYYNANVGILGEDDKGVSAAYKKMIELRVAGVGAFAKVETKLSQEQIDRARNLYDAVAETNNAVYENKEGFFRKMELQEKKEDALDKKRISSVEKKATEYEKLTSRISDLTSQMTELRLTNQPVPDSMVHELISSQAQLENVKKEVEAIAAGLVKISSKAAVNIPISGSTLPLTKRDNSAGRGATETNTSIFGEGEASQFAIEQAQVVADTTFQIMADSANAEFDFKLSLLEKEKQARLDVAKTEEEKAKIEAKFAKQAAKLKTEQFKKQKSADIIQAIINTALSVTRLLYNPPAAIAAGIAGAAQVAVIASQKVPQFDAGSASTPSQFIAGERRPEFMITPSGGVQLVTRPTLFKNMAGATVIGGEETAEIMKATNQGQRAESLAPYISRMESNIVNAIINKRELHISASGSKLTERQGEYFKTYFNRKISWVGRKN